MKNLTKLFFIASFLLCHQVSAAIIEWSVSTSSVNVNDVFSINIIATGFTDNVDGGGVNISFDSSVINIQSISIDESVWDFGGLGISTGTIDNSVGTVDGIMVNTFGDVAGDFIVATVEVKAIAEGISDLSLTEYTLNPWASGGVAINPDYVNGTVEVSAVPLPAAIWLFGSGLLGLISVARRKVA